MLKVIGTFVLCGAFKIGWRYLLNTFNQMLLEEIIRTILCGALLLDLIPNLTFMPFRVCFLQRRMGLKGFFEGWPLCDDQPM